MIPSAVTQSGCATAARTAGRHSVSASSEERVVGTPGRYALTAESVLRCPWHGWEFDLETGRCRDDESMRVAVYPADVRDGRVFVKA